MAAKRVTDWAPSHTLATLSQSQLHKPPRGLPSELERKKRQRFGSLGPRVPVSAPSATSPQPTFVPQYCPL